MPIDWPAWTQAVGSVVAIAAAIWIDQGAARRLRAERAAGEAADRERRIAAVENCIAALAWVHRDADAWDTQHRQVWRLGGAHRQALRASLKAIQFYLRDGAPEVEGALVVLLTHTEDRMNVAIARIEEPAHVHPSTKVMFVNSTADAVREVRELLEQYRTGVLAL